MTNNSKKTNNNLLKETITIVKDKFWHDDIEILFKYDRMDEFFPSKDMTLEEKLNSLTRLSMYLSAVLTAYTGNTKYLYIFIITLGLTYLVYMNMSEKFTEGYGNVKYIKPTLNNPFMNVMPDDYIKRPNRESINKANQYINPNLNKKIEGYDEILQTHELKTLEKNKYAKEIGFMLKSLQLSKSIKSNKTVSFRVLAQIASAVPKRVKFSKIEYNGADLIMIEGSASSDQDILKFIDNLGKQKLVEQASLSSMRLPKGTAGSATMKGFRVFVKFKRG